MASRGPEFANRLNGHCIPAEKLETGDLAEERRDHYY
jgi:hypothetical protein